MQAITFCEFLRFLRDLINLWDLRDINKELFCRLGCKYLSLIEH